MKNTRNSSSEDFDTSGMYTMALVGLGPAGQMLAGLLAREEFTETFPWVKLVGWVPCNGEEPHLEALFGAGPDFARYPTCEALFEAYPELDMACDLSPDGEGMQLLLGASPGRTTLITEKTVRRFCELTAEGVFVIGGAAKLRLARDMFTTLMDQVDEDILVLDSNGQVVDCNRHVLDRLGLSKSDCLGRPCGSMDGGEACRADTTCAYHEVMRTGEKVFSKFSLVTPDGRMRYFRVIAFPVVRAGETVRRVVLMRSDITDKVQIEQRLQQSEKMAAIGELSTYIAHEIRNPLFAIGGFANSLLRSPSLDDSAREKARIILEESKRLDEILRSILNFARPTDQAVAEVDVNFVAAQTVELMRIGGEERRIDLRQDLTPELPKVRGNAEMLKQCLINLVKNAQEALPSEGGSITVRTSLRGGRVYVDVADTGQGIPPELQEQVFSPFFSTKDKGAGLGLAMTRKIIEEMGGKVILQSQTGVGTTITLILLPVLAVSDEQRNPDRDARPEKGEPHDA